MQYTQMKKQKQGGFTLIELMIVLVAFVLIAVGVYAMSGTMRSGAVTDQATKGAMGLVAAIQRNYPTPSYTGITTTRVYKQAPSNLLSGVATAGQELRDPWGGTIAIAAAGTPAGSAYTITFPAVPGNECTPFAKGLAPNFTQIRVGTTNILNADGSVNEANLTTACNVTAPVAMQLTGN